MDPRRTFMVALTAALLSVGWAGADSVDWPAAPGHPQSVGELVDALARAYRNLDYELYETLFANEEEHGVPFHFFVYEPTPAGETEWGFATEMRIHRRMFQPDALPAGEAKVPEQLRVRSIAIELIPLCGFEERWDYYRSEHNPSGELDRNRWRAAEALYSTSVVWNTESGTSFGIAGQARFVVIEDLAKVTGQEGKFLFYRWEDLGPGENGIVQASR